MKIKVKQDFRDRSADLALRKKGEVLDVSEQRAKELPTAAAVPVGTFGGLSQPLSI